MAELTKRVIVAAIGIPIAFGLIYIGGYVFLLAIILLSNLVLWELYQITNTKNIQPNFYLGLIFNSAFLALIFLLSTNPYEFRQLLFSLFLIVFIFPILVFLIQVFSKTSNTTANASVTIASAFWVSFSFASLIAIRLFPNFILLLGLANIPISTTYKFLSGEGTVWFFVAILVSIWICDSFAYFVGKAMGHHKLAPKISPNKTIEGAISGIAGASIGVLISDTIFGLQIPTYYILILTGIVGIVGQAGDLAESKIKRDFNVKDSSNTLPGHGGFLDRFDSIMFVFPAVLISLLILSL